MECVSWYNLGDPWCASGYETYHYEVPGHPVGRYCQRPCSDSEQRQCNAQLCDKGRALCSEHATAPRCQLAVKRCEDPVKMPENVCVSEDLRESVLYDTARGTCSVDKSVKPGQYGPGSKDVTLEVVVIGSDERLKVTCSGLSEGGAVGYRSEIGETDGLQCSDFGDRCAVTERSVLDEVVTAGKMLCDREQRAYGKEAVFESKIEQPPDDFLG
ncbi:hypothetical protein P170DRAFT_494313 [Aspergillus steynii IBT 23096]|uniref:Uncharacterized protein n=1 Tax=Aspergillus steynii IBT 23096 TaxID=1392250 RepID=A0A2I2G7D9_9EURO|nr:uncharacterized protein P170DRAFT_494313 [Aspergillus steynii IBT 23096]PLB48807.1 hypothetical protein P170DRAFT_494313 [Aspergillus steynii IBT 23096]